MSRLRKAILATLRKTIFVVFSNHVISNFELFEMISTGLDTVWSPIFLCRFWCPKLSEIHPKLHKSIFETEWSRPT
jgi:hypothetical protein